MKNVAIYLSGVTSLKGGGGVERFFSDFFKIYSNWNNRQFKLFYFMDQSTYAAILEVGKLDDNIKNVVLLKNASNRFKKQIENIDLFLKIKKHNIELFHCANYGRHDFNRMMFLRKLSNGPKLVQNIVDCQIPYRLKENNKGYLERFVSQPNLIRFDGVFSWYEYYKNYVSENKLFTFNPNITCITSRFVLFEEKIKSMEKENTFIFASRLDTQKKPDWYIQAVKTLVDRSVVDWRKWNFELYGNGPMHNELEDLTNQLGLGDIIKFKKSNTLFSVFPKTKVYISTQDFENFPSLSMMEAMACSNIIIARDVGQTSLMVRDNYNGLVLKEDNPLGLCNAMEQVIRFSEKEKNDFMANSLKMVTEVHSPTAFIKQIEEFWQNLLR